MDGTIWLGPNAVLAFAREGYNFWDINPPELWNALTYPGFFKTRDEYWQVRRGRKCIATRAQRVRRCAATLHPLAHG